MNTDTIKNIIFSVTVNPLLSRFLDIFDVDCPKDGNLLINSLRRFLGDEVKLCERCEKLSDRIMWLYEAGCSLLKVDREFMRKQFLQDQYGTAWFKGFALMMKGIKKYGVRIPFVPAAPFLIVWDYTYRCNLKCKHCYEDAGRRGYELSTDEAKQVVDRLSRLASIGLPALSFSGGEPLAREDFFEVAAYAKKKIPYISVASNGTLITRDNAKRLKDVGVDYVEISLDGARACLLYTSPSPRDRG